MGKDRFMAGAAATQDNLSRVEVVARTPSRERPRRLSAAGALVALCLGLSLASCGGNGLDTARMILGTEVKPCPKPVIVSDAKYIYDLDPGRPEVDAVRVAGRITTPAAVCTYKEGRIFVELSLPFQAARGPVLATGRLEFEFPYFVAVTDRFNNILAKEVFVARIKMGGDQERSSTVEKVEQVIPFGPAQDGSHFLIYIGFQLTPGQVDFNRRHRL